MDRRGVIAALVGTCALKAHAAGKRPIVDVEYGLIIRFKDEAIELSGKEIIDSLKSKAISIDVAPSLTNPYPDALTSEH